MKKKSKYNQHSDLDKIQSYCAYQERCIKDVKDKLKRLGVDNTLINPIISKLQKENFLNEERYAKSFAIGKLRNNNWGKIKIRYELYKKLITQPIVDKAISNIDEDEYFKILENIILNKTKEIKKPLENNTKYKILRSLLTKGFEIELINKIIEAD